jgi:hypothetical protein
MAAVNSWVVALFAQNHESWQAGSVFSCLTERSGVVMIHEIRDPGWLSGFGAAAYLNSLPMLNQPRLLTPSESWSNPVP